MNGPNLATPRRPALSLGLVALLGTALMGCASPAEQRQANLQYDGSTCSSFGASYGSPQHSACMLAQQQRRDDQVTHAMEASRVSSEIARNNQVAAALRGDD